MNRKHIAIVIIFCFIVSHSSFVFAAATVQPIITPSIGVVAPIIPGADIEAIEPKISKTLSSNVLVPLFAKLNKTDREVVALSADFKTRGFLPSTGKNNLWGLRNTFVQRTADGQEQKSVLSLCVQDYAAPANSKDVGALVRLELIGADGRKETYTCSLTAPNGNFDLAEERTINLETLGIEKANSWWSCVKDYLRNRCASACISSLTTCGGTWVAYLACVALRCGGCFIKGSLCCACNCKWWCRWAVGCCHR